MSRAGNREGSFGKWVGFGQCGNSVDPILITSSSLIVPNQKSILPPKANPLAKPLRGWGVLCAFTAVACQRLMFRVTFRWLPEGYDKSTGRLQSDCRKIMGRRQQDDRKSTVRFRSGLARNDGPFREAFAKHPRSHCGPPPLWGLAMSLSREAKCLSYRLPMPHLHRLNLLQLHEGANVRDVCGTSIREARLSHSAKPREANPSTISGLAEPPPQNV